MKKILLIRSKKFIKIRKSYCYDKYAILIILNSYLKSIIDQEMNYEHLDSIITNYM